MPSRLALTNARRTELSGSPDEQHRLVPELPCLFQALLDQHPADAPALPVRPHGAGPEGEEPLFRPVLIGEEGLRVHDGPRRAPRPPRPSRSSSGIKSGCPAGYGPARARSSRAHTGCKRPPGSALACASGVQPGSAGAAADLPLWPPPHSCSLQESSSTVSRSTSTAASILEKSQPSLRPVYCPIRQPSPRSRSASSSTSSSRPVPMTLWNR